MTNMNHAYEILGLSPAFQLTDAELRKAFLKQSARWHPDRAADDQERERYTARAELINAALSQLKNMEKRGNLLLDILGGPGASEDKTLPQSLLMDMLEVRDELEDAHESGDMSALASIQTRAKADRQALIADLGGMFEQAMETKSTEDLKAIRVKLNELRYIERLIEQSDEDYQRDNAMD